MSETKKVDSYDYMFKIVVVGESGVGKTNLISRFTKNQFTSDTASTIGVEFTSKVVEIDNKYVKAQLWDTAGQERYQAVATAYYRNGLGGLLVFDLSKRSSFENLDRWYKNIEEYMPNARVILIGNKLDLNDAREVNKQEAQDYADQRKMKYIETSALNCERVEEAFVELLKEVYRKQSELGFNQRPITNSHIINPAKYNSNNSSNSGSFGEKFSNCCSR